MKHFLLAVLLPLAVLGAPAPVNNTENTETADEFIARVNADLQANGIEYDAISWLRATFINHDTGILASRSAQKYAAWHSQAVADSLSFKDAQMSASTARAIGLLKLGTSRPAPADEAKRKEIAEIATSLKGMYGQGKYCPQQGGECFSGSELEELIAVTRDYDKNLEYWVGWRKIGVPMRQPYQRFTELANEGAVELGYGDLGEMWRSNYDMSPARFEAEATRLWNQVEPLYEELHCHVRAKLGEFYGRDKVPQGGPIPAHLLGNMWAQSWDRIYDVVEPYPEAARLDVTSTLVARNMSPQDMVRSAEDFYVSLGFDQLPATFWERSQFSKPRDREVQCHASAWGMDGGKDLRIKMCIKQTYNELKVIYHELGHNIYQRAYSEQQPLFRGGANDGFHEAIGDTVVLAMTPGYLQEVGFIEKVDTSPESEINDQMIRALRRIAVLPWAKLVDEWRWGVFSGDISPQDYNAAWWALREEYQGVAAPVARSETDFDPGAKYHIPGNVPYTRYFLSLILQFQFLQALCNESGYEGPLHQCSFYGSEKAGEKFNAMLMAGQSEPWQDTLEKLTGTRQMDGAALIAYFQPLMAWLKEQNAGRQCGW